MNSKQSSTVISQMLDGRHLRKVELLILLIVVSSYFLFPNYHTLISQIFIFCLFVLSLDLLVGYAGLVTLGHAAFFGIGAYGAGLYAIHVSSEPLSGLVAGAVSAGLIGLLSGALILRT